MIPIQTFRSAPFKGLNEKLAPHLIDDGESPYCYGVYSTETGAIVKQKGDELFASTTSDIIGLYCHKISTDSQKIIVIGANSKAEVYNTSGTKIYDLKILRLFAVHKGTEDGISSLPPWQWWDKKTEFSVPIDGIVWDGTNLWTCDIANNKIRKHSGFSTTISATYDAPAGAGVSGLAWDGSNLWSCGYNNNTIYKHNMDATLSVAFSFTYDTVTYGTNPRDITYDPAGYIWIAVEAGNKILKYTTAGVYTLHYNSPANTPQGIAYDPKKNCLWIYCQASNSFYKTANLTTSSIEKTFNTSNVGFRAIAFFYNILDGFYPNNPVDRTDKFVFATFKDKTYFCNGLGPVYEYDSGEYAYFLYEATRDTEQEKPKYITVFENRLLLAGFLRNSSAVYYSDLLDPDTWDVNNYFEINPDDGNDIKGFIEYKGDLIIFKANSKWKISSTGDWDTPFYITKIDNIGTTGHHTIIEANNYLYFMSWDGIYQFDGVNSIKISVKAPDAYKIIRQGLSFVPIVCHIKGEDINQIWWARSVSSAPLNERLTLAYDYTIDSWFSLNYSTNPYLFFLKIEDWSSGYETYLAAKGSGIFKINYTYSDFINALIDTKPFDFGIPHKDKKVKRAYITVKNEASNYNLNFYISVDGKSWKTLPSISLYEADGGDKITRIIDLRERVGKRFQFRFENNGVDQPFTIYEYSIEYQVLPRI